MSTKPLYLSALSGGADSTALLLYLLEKGKNVEAVHCNFHLRGEESNRDEEFCKKLCKEHGVKLHIAHFDTISYAKMHHESIETAARNLRYNYFFQLIGDLSAEGICVAHNRNDQAETLLMKLVRGAGIHGLSGMKPVTKVDYHGKDMKVFRPLLGVSRKEIESFLNKRNQSWVTDSTNLEDDATRNKFRLNIIPLLEGINPSAIENIAKAAERLQTVEVMYDDAISKGIERVSDKKSVADIKNKNEIHISIAKLKAEISSEAILFEILNPLGFNGDQIKDINNHLEGTSGREWSSPTHQVIIDRSDIIVAKSDEMGKKISMRIPEEGNYVISDSQKIILKHEKWTADSVIPRTADKIALDYDKVEFPLMIRNYEQGDKFVPFGMKGSKLISDFLTDQKATLIDKRNQLVLCNANGEILWLVGRRPDNRFCITKNTKEALIIRIE